MPDFLLEQQIGGEVCGIDEVGRGPLAGPVTAAAVYVPKNILNHDFIALINDSKKLTAKKREILAVQIKEHCLWAIGEASVEEIDQINILQATFTAMRRAFEELSKQCSINHALIDGNKSPSLPCPSTTVIKGDQTSTSIAAASILAKVHRDQYMARIANDHPGYGWESNAGYGSKKHIEAIHQIGVTPYHRKSFEPIKSLLDSSITN